MIFSKVIVFIKAFAFKSWNIFIPLKKMEVSIYNTCIEWTCFGNDVFMKTVTQGLRLEGSLTGKKFWNTCKYTKKWKIFIFITNQFAAHT